MYFIYIYIYVYIFIYICVCIYIFIYIGVLTLDGQNNTHSQWVFQTATTVITGILT
jgi:hypothetical protein